MFLYLGLAGLAAFFIFSNKDESHARGANIIPQKCIDMLDEIKSHAGTEKQVQDLKNELKKASTPEQKKAAVAALRYVTTGMSPDDSTAKILLKTADCIENS